MVLQSPPSPHRRPYCEASKTNKKGLLHCKSSSTVACGRERPQLPAAVADRMQQQRQTRPILARSGLDRARKAPPPHCIRHAPSSPPRAPAPPSARGAATAPKATHPDPVGAQRAQIWAGRASPAALRLPASQAQTTTAPRRQDRPGRARTVA
jgi:hypothetical protein